MNSASLISNLGNRGILLKVSGDSLLYEAPEGAITPEIIQTMKEHKAEILKYLQTTGPATLIYTISMVKEYFEKSEDTGKKQTVSLWSKDRQEQFFKLARAYSNPERGFGLRAKERTIQEAIEKAFTELKPFCKEQQKRG